jgi:hypothetical protein
MASERRVSRPASLPVETISGQSVIPRLDAKKRPSPSAPRRRCGEMAVRRSDGNDGPGKTRDRRLVVQAETALAAT